MCYVDISLKLQSLIITFSQLIWFLNRKNIRTCFLILSKDILFLTTQAVFAGSTVHFPMFRVDSPNSLFQQSLVLKTIGPTQPWDWSRAVFR